MAADLYDNVRDVKSTQETSTVKGARSAQQILEAADGKDSTALDSTIETSTTAPRSAEQIMEQMKEEEKAKKESAKSSARSKVKSEVNKWKNAGVNAKSTASEAKDTVSDVAEDVKNVSSTITNISNKSASIANALTAGMSAFGLTKAGEAVAKNASEKEEPKTDPKAVSQAMQTSAPTDTAIAEYQKDVSEAQAKGVHVKCLPYTNEQQMQWNAQDQHRMYSNYGNMYEHGSNEMEYNFALLSSAMATAGMGAPTKTLSTVPSLKQKFLAAVEKDDNQMDINTMSLERIFSGEVDLLKVDQKQGTEDLAVVNNRDTAVKDKFEAEDHGLDARDAEKKDIARSFAEAATESTKRFTESILDRGQQAVAELGIDKILDSEKQSELEADFF